MGRLRDGLWEWYQQIAFKQCDTKQCTIFSDLPSIWHFCYTHFVIFNHFHHVLTFPWGWAPIFPCFSNHFAPFSIILPYISIIFHLPQPPHMVQKILQAQGAWRPQELLKDLVEPRLLPAGEAHSNPRVKMEIFGADFWCILNYSDITYQT